MKLKSLNPNDKFKTDSGIVMQLLPLTKSDIQYLKRNKLTDRYKCKHLANGQIYWLIDNMIIGKI